MFTTKHNDRNFDVTHAEHIHPAKTQENIYWDWLNGMRTGERSADVPSFEEVERIFYERHYSDYVAGQCARNAERRHTERNRTVEQIRRDKRTCPEETIFQFGKEGIGATPEQLLDIFTAFKQQFEERYGAHVHMLDWAMHCDEATVHIQERHCFDYVNKYG
ncbi:MAG: serine/arginine repetitive matrix protein 2, partial [Christensenellales bacterium]|nr:serine/arginine repetitive matrix protein 2 [Christensenellales bacterium]